MDEITIIIEVDGKIAKSPHKKIVCDNSDYYIEFHFSPEWDQHAMKTARFKVNGSEPIDVIFSGNRVQVPPIQDTSKLEVGVYAGNLRTTTPALIGCLRSIRSGGGKPKEPQPDKYDQIMEAIDGLRVEKGVPSDEPPLMDGEGSPGESKAFARGDHIHPTDTTRASAKDLDAEIERAKEAEKNLADTKQDALVFDGEYNKETNPAATLATVTRKIAEIIANAPEDFDTLKELADWLETHGTEAAKMNSDIKKNAEDIAAINEGLTDYVKYSDEPGNALTGGKPGPIALNYATSCGLRMVGNAGQRYLTVHAGEENDWLRRNGNCVFVVSNLDAYIKIGITGKKRTNVNGKQVDSYGNQIALTADEQSSAQKWLGVPTNLDEFTDKMLTDESLAKKYTAEDYPVGYGDDYFGLASTDILPIDELDYYAVTVYFDHWDVNESETVTYLLSELSMTTENYGYLLSKGNAKIYIVTDSYAFADAYQIPVTSNGLYFSKYRGPYENVDIISVERLPIKKIDSMYLDIPVAGAETFGLVKASKVSSSLGYSTCVIFNGRLYSKDYSNETSGQIYGICSTAETTTAKTVSDYGYRLTKSGIVAIKFNNAVGAGSSLQIGSNSARPMRYRGKAITANVIKAGDIATFMYSGSYYDLLSVDRWHEDIEALSARIAALETK